MVGISTSSKKRDLILGAILVAAVFVAYIPVWQAAFIWDDNINLTDNPCIVGLLGLKEIWTTSAAQFYPLTLTTFWVEHALWGLRPLPYHLMNVFVHGACAIVLWQVLRKLLVPGAWFGAALWALHPLQVESVAWITELKNTQSGLFYLLSILFFVKGLKARDWNWNYALTLLFAALAMASKSSTVVLPLVLCLCAWWMEGRWNWRNLLKIAPIIPVVIVACALTLWTQVWSQESPTFDPSGVHTWQGHLAAAGEGFWFYLGKSVWPHPLITLYPRFNIDNGNPLSYLPFLAVIIVLFVLWLKRESWARPWFFAFTYFLVALLPELEFAGWYIGDHFQYLAAMGPLALLGAGLGSIPVPLIRRILATILLLLSGLATWMQSGFYRNEETLWTHTLEWNPDCCVGLNNLGLVFNGRGNRSAAIEKYQAALRLYPNYELAHYNLGIALQDEGRWDEAIAQYQQSVQLAPNDTPALNRLGNLLLLKGRIPEAIVELQKAVASQPDFPQHHFNLGNALSQTGRFGEAADEYRKAIKLQPDYADAYNALGIVLAQQDDIAGAASEFQKALQIQPGLETAKKNLAHAEEMLRKKPKP